MSASDERHFERRMGLDPNLRSQVERLRGAIGMLRDLPRRDPAPAFNEKVIGRIREDELADNARQRILASGRTWWQRGVEVGFGAVAAALVVALVGLPGGNPQPMPEFELTGGGESVAAVPLEDDLLLLLADHCRRFDALRRNVRASSLVDDQLQRPLLRMEIEASDLSRRTDWLAAAVEQLPPERRLEYATFIDAVQPALHELELEIEQSARQSRAPDIHRVLAALDSVPEPEGLREAYRIIADNPRADGHRLLVTESGSPELRLFARVRQADYRHDHAAVIAAADELVSRHGHTPLADRARVARVEALLTLGRDRDAAEYFQSQFSGHEQHWSPKQAALFRAYFKLTHKARLFSALEALPQD